MTETEKLFFRIVEFINFRFGSKAKISYSDLSRLLGISMYDCYALIDKFIEQQRINVYFIKKIRKGDYLMTIGVCGVS